MNDHAPLPVSGYKPQAQDKIDLVNGFKADEERLLRKLDALRDLGRPTSDPFSSGAVDQRWLAIGRTDLEKAFMAINRSIFQPGRVQLPEDAA